MVKRKANVGIDEWLAERYSRIEVAQSVTVAAEEEIVAAPEPVAEVATGPTPVGQVATVTGEVAAMTGKVAAQCEDAARWFWELLATAGYEEC